MRQTFSWGEVFFNNLEKTMQFKRILATIGLVVLATTSQAAYIVGGAAQSLITDSGEWAWDGAYMQPFRAALENPANFGPGGVVNQSISTTTLNTVDATTLSGVNMFVGTWISDAQASPMQAAIMAFFLGGGDLWLLQDDSSHDGLGSALGVHTTLSDGSASNGGAPLFNGPFGSAADVRQLYAVGRLDELAIAALGGTVSGRNASNQVTSAFWSAGQYAAGAGSLFITADIDMIASTGNLCGAGPCGATYSPLNDNGIYALNTMSFLQENGGSSVPEPSSLVLIGVALALLAFRRRA